MSKTEFLRLYKTTVAEKEAVAKKYGQYPCACLADYVAWVILILLCSR